MATALLAAVGGLLAGAHHESPHGLLVWVALAVPLLAGLLYAGRKLGNAAEHLPDAPKHWSDRRLMLVLALGALLPRVVWVLVAQTEPISDFAEYRDLAHHLCRHHQFGLDAPTAYRPIGLPAVLSVLDCAGLDVALAGGLLNAFAQAATVPAIFLWTRALADRRAATAASLVFACWPAQILGCSLLATEPLFGLLLAWSFYVAARLPQSTRPGRLIALLGVLIGAATYVRATALVLPLSLAALAFLRPSGWRSAVRFGAVLAVAVLCLLPWGVRNHQQLGQFSLTTTNTGMTLLYGNSDGADGGYIDPVLVPKPPENTAEVARDAWSKKQAMAWISAHPARFAELVPQKWFALWGPEFTDAGFSMTSPRWQPWQPLAKALSAVFYLLILALAAQSAWHLRASRFTDPACAALLLWFAVHTVFHGQSRYHMPLASILCVLAFSRHALVRPGK